MTDKNTIEKINILKNGINGEFWKIIVEAIKDCKTPLEADRDSEDIADLSSEQYKFEMELIKTKLKYLDKLAELPNTIIQWLEKPESDEIKLDPYD